MSDPDFDPAEALALAGRTRRRTIERGLAWWYHPVVGLAVAIMTGGLALPSPVIGSIVGLMIITVNFLVWQKRTGLGPIRHTRRTWPVVIAVAVLVMGGFLVVFELWHRFGVEWAPLAGAPVLGLMAGFGSWIVDRAWAAEQADA